MVYSSNALANAGSIPAPEEAGQSFPDPTAVKLISDLFEFSSLELTSSIADEDVQDVSGEVDADADPTDQDPLPSSSNDDQSTSSRGDGPSTASSDDGPSTFSREIDYVSSTSSSIERLSLGNRLSSHLFKGSKTNWHYLSQFMDDPQFPPEFSTSNQSTPFKPPTKPVPTKQTDISYPQSMVDLGIVSDPNGPIKRWDSSDDRRVAQTVHDLVTERYRESYRKLLEKLRKKTLSEEHHTFRSVVAELETMFERTSYAEGLCNSSSSILKNVQDAKRTYRSMDSLLQSEDVDSRDAISEPRQSLIRWANHTGFNEYNPPTISVGTDDASALLSSRSTMTTQKRRAAVDSFASPSYEDVLYASNEALRDSASETREPDSSSEIVTDLDARASSDGDRRGTQYQILVNESIIGQTHKLLKYGARKWKSFVGSHAHLESERILLVSQLRRQLLISNIYGITAEPSGNSTAKITIKNLKCTLNNPDDDSHPAQNAHYAYVLQHGTTVHSTELAVPNRLGWLDFDGSFTFDDAHPNFNIKIQLYCVTLPREFQKCFALCRLVPRLPTIKLLDEIDIALDDIKDRTFTFSETGHKLSACVDVSLCWPQPLRVFLTIGMGKADRVPVWNRWWCVAEEGHLRYFFCPTDEVFCRPIGRVDLTHCKSFEESDIKYVNDKTLILFFDESRRNTILLSADSRQEFDSLRNHLEVVLDISREWNKII